MDRLEEKVDECVDRLEERVIDCYDEIFDHIPSGQRNTSRIQRMVDKLEDCYDEIFERVEGVRLSKIQALARREPWYENEMRELSVRMEEADLQARAREEMARQEQRFTRNEYERQGAHRDQRQDATDAVLDMVEILVRQHQDVLSRAGIALDTIHVRLNIRHPTIPDSAQHDWFTYTTANTEHRIKEEVEELQRDRRLGAPRPVPLPPPPPWL